MSSKSQVSERLMAISSFIGTCTACVIYSQICQRKNITKESKTTDDFNQPYHTSTSKISYSSTSASPMHVRQIKASDATTKGLDNVEVLLHNISHKDFVIALKHGDDKLLARPEFNHYNSVCEAICQSIESLPSDLLQIIHYPVSNRLQEGASNLKNMYREFKIPIGYDICLHPEPLEINKEKLRIRYKKSLADLSQLSQVVAAYMPLLSLLIPKWLAMIDCNTSGLSLKCKKILFLVSGEGTPYASKSGSPQPSTTHVDNSTEFSARIMKAFISRMYPDIQVLLIHSHTNVFRYDENTVFVKNCLLPHIERLRNSLASRIGAKWRDKLHVTLSLADGASARVSAINASLRYYRPAFMHFWQLKSFYNEEKVYEDDIECHSYEEKIMIPAIQPEFTSLLMQQTVHKMKQFIVDFESACCLPDGFSDQILLALNKSSMKAFHTGMRPA
jgi:hypothetical protein